MFQEPIEYFGYSRDSFSRHLVQAQDRFNKPYDEYGEEVLQEADKSQILKTE